MVQALFLAIVLVAMQLVQHWHLLPWKKKNMNQKWAIAGALWPSWFWEKSLLNSIQCCSFFFLQFNRCMLAISFKIFAKNLLGWWRYAFLSTRATRRGCPFSHESAPMVASRSQPVRSTKISGCSVHLTQKPFYFLQHVSMKLEVTIKNLTVSV